MNIVALRGVNIDENAPKPSIAALKERIAVGIAEMNLNAPKGALMSFQLSRDRINKATDEYIRLRTLEVVS